MIGVLRVRYSRRKAIAKELAVYSFPTGRVNHLYVRYGVERVRILPRALSAVNKHEDLQMCFSSERHELRAKIWAHSSIGRALVLQTRGREFDSRWVHQNIF